jgi:hypothetical protein
VSVSVYVVLDELEELDESLKSLMRACCSRKRQFRARRCLGAEELELEEASGGWVVETC